MHAIFIPYGKKEHVDNFFRDLQAQKYKLKMWKGKEVKHVWIEGQLRFCPFGVYEHIFPREEMDVVLTTLKFKTAPHTGEPKFNDRYDLGKVKLTILRKALKAKPAPDFKTDKAYLWLRDFVEIIPIGIREDDDIVDDTPGENFGWTHEAI